ncbi:MAG: glycosyltransferase [Desulfobacteraceae bacterium]|nr:glycosyltransferase [Desulfobacteraceae bacterium]
MELLRRHFDVRVVDFIWSRKNLKGTLTTQLNMVKGILWASVTFSWFTGFQAAFPVLLSKIFGGKSIVVTGGGDVASEPDINYGVMRFPKSKSARMVKFVLEHADLVLPFSSFSKTEVLKHSRPKRLKVVYCCADAEKFKPEGRKDDDLVITVSGVSNSTLKRKGLETFVKSARLLPGTRFVLIGKHIDDSINYLKSIASPNVEFTDFVSSEKLLGYGQKAKVYVQVSAHEGFGVALAEAMLCQCVPVVTNRGALPEVVGDAGYYVPYGEPKATAEAIKEALKSDKGKEARERIATNFPLQKRETELVKIISELG